MGSFGPNFGGNFAAAYSPIIDDNSTYLFKESIDRLMDEKDDIFEKINNDWEKYRESFYDLAQKLHDNLENLPHNAEILAIKFLELLQYLSQ